jgi:bifunctional non-homologous end joining protein LigD
MGLEGIVAKRADAPYRSGTSTTWLKIKCVTSLRFSVVGFVPSGANSIAALRLGRREGRELVYVGKAGSGFTAQSARDVRSRLEPLIRARPALTRPLKKRDTSWVEPKIEAEIEFRGMTSDGMLRHPVFKGLI